MDRVDARDDGRRLRVHADPEAARAVSASRWSSSATSAGPPTEATATTPRRPAAWLTGVAPEADRRRRLPASARRSIRSSRSRSARTRRFPSLEVGHRGFHRAARLVRARLQLRVHEHAVLADADDAAADGDQSARRVRAACSAAGDTARAAAGAHRRRPQHPRSRSPEDLARSASAASGRRDRARLDEYLDNVREVERRIQRPKQQARTTPLTVPTAPVGVPESFEEHVGADVRPAGAGLSRPT